MRNSRLIKDAATLSNAWKNVLTPMFGWFLKPKAVVEGFTDWEGEEMDGNENDLKGKKIDHFNDLKSDMIRYEKNINAVEPLLQENVQISDSNADSNMKNMVYSSLLQNISSNSGGTSNLGCKRNIEGNPVSIPFRNIEFMNSEACG